MQKPVVDLPEALVEASHQFSSLFYDQDEVYYLEPEEDVVAAFGHCELGNQAYKRILWLCLFVARRALPCRELYCDTNQPGETIEALSEYLVKGVVPENWQKFTTAAEPSCGGIEIMDCRQCDTGTMAGSAARAVQFLLSADPDDARICLDDADCAFDQSPLGRDDHFREWLADFAIPIAFLQREMTLEEQSACREVSSEKIEPNFDINQRSGFKPAPTRMSFLGLLRLLRRSASPPAFRS